MRLVLAATVLMGTLFGLVGECEAQKLRPGSGVRIEGTTIGTCPADGPPKCVFDVEVEPDGPRKCNVYFNFGSIESLRRSDGRKNVLVWRLFTIDGRKAEYSFHVKGIDITPQPTADDFDGAEFEGGDVRRFKWRSVNNRDGSFRFDIRVVRTVNGVSRPCEPYDPTIVNRGG